VSQQEMLSATTSHNITMTMVVVGYED